MLRSHKKHADTFFEQTKTKPQKTLEFKMNKQIETFLLNRPINFFEGKEWWVAVTSFKPTKFVLIISDENNTFSITTPGYWTSRGNKWEINKLRELLELRFQTDIQLHVDEVNKKGKQIKRGDIECKLSDLDTRTNDITEELKNVQYKDFDDMVFRLGLTNTELLNILDMKDFDTSTKDIPWNQAFMKTVILIWC